MNCVMDKVYATHGLHPEDLNAANPRRRSWLELHTPSPGGRREKDLSDFGEQQSKKKKGDKN